MWGLVFILNDHPFGLLANNVFFGNQFDLGKVVTHG